MKQYLGIPYLLGGDDRDGIDCWGLVCMIYREELDIDLPRFTARSMNPKEVDFAIRAGIAYDLADQVSDPQDFDIVIARRRTIAHHAGVFLHDNIIHAVAGVGMSICDRPGDFISRSGGTLEFYRIKEGLDL